MTRQGFSRTTNPMQGDLIVLHHGPVAYGYNGIDPKVDAMTGWAGHIGIVIGNIRVADNGATWVINMRSANWHGYAVGVSDFQCTDVTQEDIRVPANSPAVSFWSKGGGSPPPRQITLNVTVKLENPQRLSNFSHSNQVAVVMLQPGTSQIVIGPRVINTDANGYSGGLSISVDRSGTYDICAKARHYLGQCARNVFVSPGNTINLDFSNGGAQPAWLGDIDSYGEDNQENTLDFERIKAACIAHCGGPYPEFDMNRDGVFDTQDFSLVAYRVQHDFRGEGYFGQPFVIAAESANTSGAESEPRVAGSISLDPLFSGWVFTGDVKEQAIILDTGGDSVGSVDVMLYYDPAVIEILDEDGGTPGVQIRNAGLFPGIFRNSVDATRGVIWLSVGYGDNTSQFNGRGVVGSFRFRALTGTPQAGYTSIIPVVAAGRSTDSNGAQYGSARDILASGSVNAFVILGPLRPSPVMSLTPASDSVLGGGSLRATAQISDPGNQVDCVGFTLSPSTGDATSAEDCDSSDGWSVTLDTSSIPDQVGVRLSAGTVLRSTLAAYGIESTNLTLDRTSPQLDAVSFTPNVPVSGQQVVVEVHVRDNLGPNVHLELWANKATDGSDSGEWVRADWGDFLHPNSAQIWLYWDTNGFVAGSHLVTITMRDDAGNWNAWTTTCTVSTNALKTVAYLPLVGNGYSGAQPYYRITSVLCDKVLDVEWGSREDGAPMIVYPWHGGISEIWYLEPTEGEHTLIRSALSDKCLDVPGGTDQGGVRLIQWRCHGGENQQWRLIRLGDSFVVESRQSRKVLDVWNGSCEDHTPVIQWDRHDGNNQRWRLIQVQRPTQ